MDQDFNRAVGGDTAVGVVNTVGEIGSEMNGTGSASAFEPHITVPVYSYDDLFPALPETAAPSQDPSDTRNQWNQKMRLGSSVVTQVLPET
jgi:hypothetical protein